MKKIYILLFERRKFMLTLIGVVIVVIGFAMRFNPLLVVTVAGIATGVAGHLSIFKILTIFGEAFVKNRYLSLFILTLPVIGLLERSGLKEQSQILIGKIKAATSGRILLLYLFIRELTAALGLTSFGGHAQMVRPLVSPMAEAAAENKYGNLPEKTRNKIKAFAASADNVGVFFGEDIFIAFGAILLIKGFYDQNGIHLDPIHIALWGIPTAISAFLIHGIRLILLDKKIKKEVEEFNAEDEKVNRRGVR
jgi:Predicted membrane protein